MSQSAWKPPMPCHVGDTLSQIDTPSLLLKMDAAEKNIRTMQNIMAKYRNVSIRPHGKAHKCPALASLQMKSGAVGICCQTLSEAEAMIYGGGIKDVLLSNQVIGKAKLSRVAALCKLANVALCVDSEENVRDVNEVALQHDVIVDCLVEVNVGQNRCGVAPGEAAAKLAQLIVELPGLRFKGVQCYQGSNQHIRNWAEKQKAVDLAVAKTKLTLESLKSVGIDCSYVTGGGTGTLPLEAASGVFTEVQPGSYLLMDADYGRNLDASGGPFRDFEQSLYVLATVQSVMPGDRAVVDAGMKALSLDSGPPLIDGHPEITYYSAGDEHGVLRPPGDLKVGDLLWMIPGHCDPTVNLYDWLIGIRDNKVEAIWPILGRGPGI